MNQQYIDKEVRQDLRFGYMWLCLLIVNITVQHIVLYQHSQKTNTETENITHAKLILTNNNLLF